MTKVAARAADHQVAKASWVYSLTRLVFRRHAYLLGFDTVAHAARVC